MAIKNIFFRLLFVLFIGVQMSCQFIQPTKVSSEEIDSASSWSSDDQYPSFDDCKHLEAEEQINCFEKKTITLITTSLINEEIESTSPVNEEVLLTITINKEGNFDLENLNASDEIYNAIPDISSVLKKVVGNLPKAIPAVKTNAGAFVQTQFVLPVYIKTQQNP